jgi:flavin reductase (DIM6/NTAB) family NADH-FMN oxidoreductase RutF
MFVKKEMHSFSSADIQEMDKIFRLNLINSCTGYKSANLLGTRSTHGNTNLAVFSSITHLGSNPAIIGFVLRPTTVPRDTYKNIKETGLFTVNHIHSEVVADAHHTSAKYPEEISEFDQTDFKPEYINEFYAPYVHGAKVRLGCQYLNEYEIKENDTLLIVSKIEAIHISENILQEDGWLSLEAAQSVTINGLDGYASPKLIERFDYARPKI